MKQIEKRDREERKKRILGRKEREKRNREKKERKTKVKIEGRRNHKMSLDSFFPLHCLQY